MVTLRLLWLRYLAHCYRQQEAGLQAELAGVQYMIERNAERQAAVTGEIAEAQAEQRLRRYRVAR